MEAEGVDNLLVGRADGVAEDSCAVDLAPELTKERVVDAERQGSAGRQRCDQLRCKDAPEQGPTRSRRW